MTKAKHHAGLVLIFHSQMFFGDGQKKLQNRGKLVLAAMSDCGPILTWPRHCPPNPLSLCLHVCMEFHPKVSTSSIPNQLASRSSGFYNLQR